MLRTEMIDNLLASYTTRELKALATRLGVIGRIGDVNDGALKYWLEVAEEFSNDEGKPTVGKVYLTDPISNILFDPAGSNHEFNKLAEMEQ